VSCLVIRPEGMRRLKASVGGERSEGSNYRDPCWVCGANFTSINAMGWLRLHGVGFEWANQIVRSRRLLSDTRQICAKFSDSNGRD
jgi:hypothetical protein